MDGDGRLVRADLNKLAVIIFCSSQLLDILSMQAVHRIATLALKRSGKPDNGLQQNIGILNHRACWNAIKGCDRFTDLKLQPQTDICFVRKLPLDLVRGRIRIFLGHCQLDLYAAALIHLFLILVGKGLVVSAFLKHFFKISDDRLDAFRCVIGLDLYNGAGIPLRHGDRANFNIFAYDLNLDRHGHVALFGNKVVHARNNTSKAIFAIAAGCC